MAPPGKAALPLSSLTAVAVVVAVAHVCGGSQGAAGMTGHASGNCTTVFVFALIGADHERLRGYKELAAAMLRSAVAAHPSACAAVLSSEGGVWNTLRRAAGGALEEHVYGEAVFRGADTFAYDRLEAYRRFLADEVEQHQMRTRPSRHVAFVDADILFLRSLHRVWRQRFDIGFTFRPAFQAINTGVILVHRESARRAVAVLGEVLQQYDALRGGLGNKAMLGDQTAVSRWVTRNESHRWDFRRMEEQNGVVEGFRVLLLPATKYNWTPHVGCRIPRNAKVLHFKGREKGRMLPAWRALSRASPAGSKGDGSLDLGTALNQVIPWIGVEEARNALHKARGTLIDHCPAL